MGKLSKQLGVVLTPSFYNGVLEKVEIVDVSSNKVLIVISLKTGLVKTIVIEIDSQIPKSELEETARAINEKLSGLTLREIKETIDKRLKYVSSGNQGIIRYFIEYSENLFEVEWQEGDPIRLGSHEIIPYVVGEEWEDRITEMCPGYSARTDAQRTDLLEDYFMSKERIFCLITRKDYERLLPPEFRDNLSVLAKGFMLRRRFRYNEIKAVLRDNELGDYVVQEIYLVSNFPPRQSSS